MKSYSEFIVIYAKASVGLIAKVGVLLSVHI